MDEAHPPPPPPPPPPPHSTSPRPSPFANSKLDIFVIPEHSRGSGFLYLPSLKYNSNSFIAGFALGVLACVFWATVIPTVKREFVVVTLAGGVGLACWALGKTQGEQLYRKGRTANGGTTGGAQGGTWEEHESRPGSAHGHGEYDQWWQSGFGSKTPPSQDPPPKPPPSSHSASGAASGWEKAREETRKREEDRKRGEEVKKRQDEAAKKKDEAEKSARAAIEKQKWEQARAREKDAREREARERLAKKETPHLKPPFSPTGKRYERPTAQSVDEEHSHHHRRTPLNSSISSAASAQSESSSYAPSHSTAPTTPPKAPSHRGAYTTKDPDKILLKGVYLFNALFPKPVAQLLSDTGSVTDGLILRLTTEGLFIDDDVRGVPQREWDVKAWSLELVETGKLDQLHVLRASLRDVDGQRYVFVLPESESWKVNLGLERLRKGPLVRAMHMNGIKEPEVRGLLGSLGWV